MDMEYRAQRTLTVAKYHWQEMPVNVQMAWAGGVSTVLTRTNLSPHELAARWLVHPDVITYWAQIGDTFREHGYRRARLYLSAMSPISLSRDVDELMGHAKTCTCRISVDSAWMLSSIRDS